MASRTHLNGAGSRVRLRLATDERLIAWVRRGDAGAFEAIYDRHAPELLAFCVYMLRSRQDAEDAVQASFASAYRALRGDSRPVSLRPWLFTIARNQCLSSLRSRRPTVELNGEPALTGDPLRHAEVQEEIREMLAALRQLPEKQRTALVLTEVHGLSQAEIGTVLDARSEQVKAYVYQARSNLIAERRARETACTEIREQLAISRGPALLRGRLRRHLRSCDGCRAYADGVRRQSHHLGALLPVAPALALKCRALEQVIGLASSDPVTYAGSAVVGATAAGAAAEVAGGSVKALAVKVAAGMAAVGASAGVGISVLSAPSPSPSEVSAAAITTAPPPRASGAAALSAAGIVGASGPEGSQAAGQGAGSESRRTRAARRGPAPEGYAVAGEVAAGEISEGAAQPQDLGAASQPDASVPGAPEGGVASVVTTPAQTPTSAPRASPQEHALQRGAMQRKREERARQRAARQRESEHEPVGVDRAPKNKEERTLQREERLRVRESRQRTRESRQAPE